MLLKLYVVEFWCWDFTVKAEGVFFLILFLSIASYLFISYVFFCLSIFSAVYAVL